MSKLSLAIAPAFLQRLTSLLPILCLTVGLAQPAAAQTSATETPAAAEVIERLQTDLQFAVCRNDWNQAIQNTNQLIGSEDISADYREQLLRFRYQLQDWRTSGARFANLPNCGSAAMSQGAIAAPFAAPQSTGAVAAPLGTAPDATPPATPLSAPPLLPLAALSPATAIDISSGLGSGFGAVSAGQQIYSFNATAGSRVVIDVNVTRVLPGNPFTDDDSQLFLFDSAGRLIAENDDDQESYQSRIRNFTIPGDGTYFVVVTTFNNDPVLDGDRIVTGWEGDGGSNIEYELTITRTVPQPGL
jgi:Bacterial pre-peptidase C-terminal domain